MRVLWRLWLPLLLLPLLILTEIRPHGESVCFRNDSEHPRTVQRSRGTLFRRRRYLTFPKGSAFVVTVSVVKAIQLKEPTNWNIALETDAIWPIPNQEIPRKTRPRRPIKLKRRHRRELYANFELALNRQNLPGRHCLLRMICEAGIFLNSPGFSLTEDLLRIILSNGDESNLLDDYDVAYRTRRDCEATYPCPISILLLFLSNLYMPFSEQ